MVVAVTSFRRRPLGNSLILAGVAVAALGSALAGLGVGAMAPALAVAALLLYAGFVVPTVVVPEPGLVLGRRTVARPPLAEPHRNEHPGHGQDDEDLDDRARDAAVGDQRCESSHTPPSV